MVSGFESLPPSQAEDDEWRWRMAALRTIAPLATCVLLAGVPAAMADRSSRSETPSSAADDHDRSRGHRRDRHEDADRIVRRAYQDILDREPDEAGLRQYRSRIIDDGWSEAQVRDALRKSPEYRQKSTMTRQKAQEIVRRAYLSILK